MTLRGDAYLSNNFEKAIKACGNVFNQVSLRLQQLHNLRDTAPD